MIELINILFSLDNTHYEYLNLPIVFVKNVVRMTTISHLVLLAWSTLHSADPSSPPVLSSCLRCPSSSQPKISFLLHAVIKYTSQFSVVKIFILEAFEMILLQSLVALIFLKRDRGMECHMITIYKTVMPTIHKLNCMC